MEYTVDGIILPRVFNTSVKGAILGLTTRELALAPNTITLNVATPQSEKFSCAQLFWLENCPEFGEYSSAACAYWLLPSFSKIGETLNNAIRVKPSELGKGYDTIFWKRGEAVNIGQQYNVGANLIPRFVQEGCTFHDIILAWQRKEYTLEISKTIGELRGAYQTILRDVPQVQLDQTKHVLEVRARDTGWHNMRPLVAEVV